MEIDADEFENVFVQFYDTEGAECVVKHPIGAAGAPWLIVGTKKCPMWLDKAQASAIAALLTRWVATGKQGGDEEE